MQVDWADPDIESYVRELMNNRNICVRNLPRTVPEFQIRGFFNSLSSDQVESILRTADGRVLVTFLSPEVAKSVMEVGGYLEVGGVRIHLSWWLDRVNYSSQPRPDAKSVSQPPTVEPPASSVQEGEKIGPVEKLHQVSRSQGWGFPQYSLTSYLDNSNQLLHQYSVMVPAVPNTNIQGEASDDKQLAMMYCASAALSQLQSAAANTATSTATVLCSQEVPGLNQSQRRGGKKARKGRAARKKLKARQH